MQRSDWYFIGLMICIANANAIGGIVAISIMLISYLVEAKKEG